MKEGKSDDGADLRRFSLLFLVDAVNMRRRKIQEDSENIKLRRGD